jgi:DNA-binding winged helix-turn-helix (wHTH) protein/tetratricopeptide (TPR) repeat protein
MMPGTIHEFGEFRFLLSTRELWRAGRRVTLPRRSFECLEYLITHRERAVGRDELVAVVFRRTNVSDAQLGQIVLRARRAVDDDGNAQHTIRTIAGYGYRWVAETREVGAPETDDLHGSDAIEDIETRTDEALARVPAAGTSRTTRVALVLLAVLAIGALVAFALGRSRTAPQGTAMSLRGDSVLVLPLQVNGLREDAWVRLGAMDLVAERLRDAGLGVPPSESVIGLLSSAGTHADAEVNVDSLRSATGVRLVVRGRALRDASGWQVELAALPAQGIEIPVKFAAHDAIDAARGATDLLLAALGRNLPASTEHDVALDETLQRARAAMLANELDTARTILGASPQLAAEPARLAYRLAQIDVRAGRLDQAKAALDAVLAQAATLSDPQLHAQVLNARGATLVRRGAFADGGRDFDAALALLGSTGDRLERGQARLGRANSRVAEHRFDEALADFGAARIDLEGAGDALGVARVDANLGMLELYRGRPAVALGYLPAAADRFQSFGALHELLLTLTGVIDAQLAMLQHDAAAATLERAEALRERITDPDQKVDLLLNRAQVRTAAGRYRDAEVALAQARVIATSGNGVLRARERALEAELAWRQQHWADADAATAAALADWPASGADGDRAAVVLTRQRSLLALGRTDAARALLDRARNVPAAISDEPGRVADALAMAEWAQHEHATDVAAHWFAHATASADHRGVPVEIVAVAAARAASLLESGPTDEAAVAIGRVAPWATHDFDSALLQLRLFHALGQREPWFDALRQAQALAGEREIPATLLTPHDLVIGTLQADGSNR